MDPSALFRRTAITAEDEQFLVGRSELIREIANRIAADPMSCVIHGMRGVGKTTIAWQVVSVLLNRSRIFPREHMLALGKEKKFTAVFHKSTGRSETVGDLLVEIILDQSPQFTFLSEFPEVFQDTNEVTTIRNKFGVDLFKVVQLENAPQGNDDSKLSPATVAAQQLLGAEDAKRQFFADVIGRVRQKYREFHPVVVVDEMDRRVGRAASRPIDGLGDFIKDLEDVQFIFVGIGETLENLIKDHKSAARKLAGNVFEAPLLNKDEIRQIFTKAEGISNGELRISEPFLKLAVEYAGGIPWIAQHTGYEAIFRRVLNPLVGQGEGVTLYESDFKYAIEKAIAVYEMDKDVELSRQKLRNMSPTEIEILRIVWESIEGISEPELREAVDGKRYFQRSLKRLQEAHVVGRRGLLLAYPDPALRVFAKYVIDESAKKTSRKSE